MPKLHLTPPEGDPLKFDLSLERVRIGRAPGNEIILEDASISSNHAELILEKSGDFRLVDLESTNGAKVNGEKISEQILKAGDSVRLGNVEGKYESEITPPPSSAPKSPSAPAGASGVSGTAAGTTEKDAWAEDEPAAPSATQSASRAAVAKNAGGFGKHEKKKDPGAGLLVTLSVAAMMLCLVAAVMALTLSAGN